MLQLQQKNAAGIEIQSREMDIQEGKQGSPKCKDLRRLQLKLSLGKLLQCVQQGI